MPLQFDAWPTQLVDRYARSARALCDDDSRLTPAQVNDLHRMAGLVDLTDWSDDQVRGFIMHVLETASVTIAEPTPPAAPEVRPMPAAKPTPKPAREPAATPAPATGRRPGPGGVVVAIKVNGVREATAESFEGRGGTDIVLYRGDWGVQASGRLWHRPSGTTIDFPERVIDIVRPNIGHPHVLVTATGRLWIESGLRVQEFRPVRSLPKLGHVIAAATDGFEMMIVDRDGWVTTLEWPGSWPAAVAGDITLATRHRQQINGATQVSCGHARIVLTSTGIAHVGDGVRYKGALRGYRHKPPSKRDLDWGRTLPALRELSPKHLAIDWTGRLVSVHYYAFGSSGSFVESDRSGHEIRLLRGDTALSTEGALLRIHLGRGSMLAEMHVHRFIDVVDFDVDGETIIVVTKDPETLCAELEQHT